MLGVFIGCIFSLLSRLQILRLSEKFNEDLGLSKQPQHNSVPRKVVKLVNKFSGGEEFNDAQECKRKEQKVT